MSTTRIATSTYSARTILGTEWPVYDALDRDEMHGRVRWVVTRGICNGVPSHAETYRTRREALAALGTPDPR